MIETEEFSAEVTALLEDREFNRRSPRAPKKKFCKYGHDRTAEGAVSKAGQCVVCAREKSREHSKAARDALRSQKQGVGIEFKDPPLPSTPSNIIAALKSRPGEWALVKRDASMATPPYWRKTYPGIEVQASTIGKPKNKCDVYARWVGVK